MPLLLVAFAFVAVIPAALIVDGLRNGEVKAKGGSYSRNEQPGWFWTVIGTYAGLIAWIAYLAADLSLS